MSTQQPKDLTCALLELKEILTTCLAESEGNVWDRLVQNCHDATVNQKFVEPIEKKILEYIATLSDADKREIWAMTETGQMNGGDPDAWHISGIEMDLEIELLDEMLDQAFRQAQERESNRKKRRTRPLQPTEYHG